MSDAVLVAIIAAIASVLSAIIAFVGVMISLRNGRKADAIADGMQHAMIRAKQGEAVAIGHAEGLLAGEAKEQARTAPARTK